MLNVQVEIVTKELLDELDAFGEESVYRYFWNLAYRFEHFAK